MRRHVEDAGALWCSGLFGIWRRLSGATSGATTVGGRELVWRVAGGRVVVVTHAGAGGTPASYSVEIASTPTPHGGARPWWLCPGCGRRCGMLYLFGDRDRLACRACCGLGFASQYPRAAGKRGQRVSEPAFTVTTTVTHYGNGRWRRVSERVQTYPHGARI